MYPQFEPGFISEFEFRGVQVNAMALSTDCFTRLSGLNHRLSRNGLDRI